MTIKIKETTEGYMTERHSEWNENKSRVIVLSADEYKLLSETDVFVIKDLIHVILNK